MSNFYGVTCESTDSVEPRRTVLCEDLADFLAGGEPIEVGSEFAAQMNSSEEVPVATFYTVEEIFDDVQEAIDWAREE